MSERGYEVEDFAVAIQRTVPPPFTPEWERARVSSDEDMVRWGLDVQVDDGIDEVVQEAARQAFERILSRVQELA